MVLTIFGVGIIFHCYADIATPGSFNQRRHLFQISNINQMEHYALCTYIFRKVYCFVLDGDAIGGIEKPLLSYGRVR